jgi:DNA invertase Pin-like site-specific DNA recombinase
VAELSRLGRNMLETLNIISALTEDQVNIAFVRQPELSTTATHGKLLLAVYSYFAEAERDYIAMRTKQGLEAAKAKGVQLGRPTGSKNKKGKVLDPFREQIGEYLEMKLPISSICKIVNKQMEKPLSYNSYKYFISKDEALAELLSN